LENIMLGLLHLLLKLPKESLTHILFVFLMMIQIIMLKLGKLYRYSRLYEAVKNPLFHQL